MKGLLFTYLLTYGGAVCFVVHPFYGLLIYVCFAIIRPESLWHWSVPAGNYSRIIAIALLVGWALHGFGNWQLGRAKPVMIAFVGFWLWAALSHLCSAAIDIAWSFLEGTRQDRFAVRRRLHADRFAAELKQLAWIIVLSQGYVALEMNMSYFSGFNRLQFVGFGGMDNNSSPSPWSLGPVWRFPWAWARRRLEEAACLRLCGLDGPCIMFSFSRGGMLGADHRGSRQLLLMPKSPGDRPVRLGGARCADAGGARSP